MSVTRTSTLTIVFGLLILLPGIVAASQPIGGDQGWYVVHCNVDGAQVSFDNTAVGTITGGVLYVPAYTTGTPYQTFTVSKDGYTTASGQIQGVPGKGETLDLYATLNPVVPTTPAIIGGDIGWYTVHCNVDGATVSFDNDVKGQIAQGTLTVQVYTTGTPYRTFTVAKPGYTTFTDVLSQYPEKGQTVDLYATLNPVPTTTAPTPVPTTKSPLPAELFGAAVVAAFVGIALFKKN